MSDEKALELIMLLKKVPGAVSYDGDASVQVAFHLNNGEILRIGITDNDVSEGRGLWFDDYKGLNNDLKKFFSK
jgi:hypothetical protein